MKAKIDVELKPFLVPNFVILKSVDRDSRSLALGDLDAVTLDKLCEEFTREVFKKANKQRPAQLG